MSANVFGQSTGIAPFPGASHPYSVTVNGSDTYVWSVTKGDLTTDAGSDATITNGNTASSTIKWAAALTPDDVYYVHVVESNASCTNEKVLKVIIHQNDFKLDIASVVATSCYDNGVAITLDTNGDPIYTHGAATLKYTIDASGVSGTEAWSFNYANILPTGVTAANPTISSGSATVNTTTKTISVSTGSSVQLTFVVTNANTYNNSSDALGNMANYTSEVQISVGQTAKGVVENGTGDHSASTIVDRPHTTGIQTN
jgi:hypothetical protein